MSPTDWVRAWSSSDQIASVAQLVRDQPDPPFLNLKTWGISSAGRAPALQAGGRRFDPVILHHSFDTSSLNTKAASQEASLLLIGISRSIGCSLTIHRVESALLTETAFMADRAVNNMNF